jgi:signal transduction histidine kinase
MSKKDFAVVGMTLLPDRDLPLDADDNRRHRGTLLRLLLLPTALLAVAAGVIVRFLFAAVPAGPAEWLLVLLASAGAGVGLAGYWMAAHTAALIRWVDAQARQMRTQLIQVGKMDEWVETGNDIVHEINNPLQVMMSELALIQTIAEDLTSAVPEQEAQKVSMLTESTQVIGDQIKRCSKIALRLRNFSRETESSLS